MALAEYDEERKRLKQRLNQADTEQVSAIERKFKQLGGAPKLQERQIGIAREKLAQEGELAQGDINAEETAALRKQKEIEQQRAEAAAELQRQQEFQTGERLKSQEFATQQRQAQESFQQGLLGQELQFNQEKFNENLAFSKDSFNQQLALEKDVAEFNKMISSEEMRRENEAIYNQIFGGAAAKPAVSGEEPKVGVKPDIAETPGSVQGMVKPTIAVPGGPYQPQVTPGGEIIIPPPGTRERQNFADLIASEVLSLNGTKEGADIARQLAATVNDTTGYDLLQQLLQKYKDAPKSAGPRSGPAYNTFRIGYDSQRGRIIV